MGTGNFDAAEVMEELRKNEDLTFVFAEEGSDFTDAVNRVSFHRHEFHNTEFFAMKLETGNEVRLEEMLLAAAEKGLTFAYIYDYDKSYWLSVEYVVEYKSFDRPYEHLKQITAPGPWSILSDMIDISDIPGHQRLTYTMQLMAAPEMWFGPGSWKYFDKQRVAAFPEAKEVKWLSPDVLYVKLFEWDVADYEAEEVVQLQRRFREWSGMNEVEAQLQEKVRELMQF